MSFVYFLIAVFCFWAIVSRTFRDGVFGKVCYGICFIGSIIAYTELQSICGQQCGIPILMIGFLLLCVRTFLKVNYKAFFKQSNHIQKN